MIIILLGAPGAGKGTIANVISSNSGLLHISTGDMLREVAKEDQEVRNLISNGEFVPDVKINELLINVLESQKAENGVILDGYPRTLAQAKLLKDTLANNTNELIKVIQIEVSESVVFERILNRKTCSNCKKVYGFKLPSKDGKTCDLCGGVLETRQDDTEITLRNRLAIYNQNTKPIIEYYKDLGLLKVINGNMPVEEVLKQILI